MQKLTQFTIGILSLLILSTSSFAQDQKGQDSVSQINVKLLGILNQKTPSKYKIRSVKVVGNQFFDENLLLSLSTLNEGDEVALPGGDNFAKAIRKLMDQNYFSDVSVYLTDVKGN
jgi:outer membrane protein insertion porin family